MIRALSLRWEGEQGTKNKTTTWSAVPNMKLGEKSGVDCERINKNEVQHLVFYKVPATTALPFSLMRKNAVSKMQLGGCVVCCVLCACARHEYGATACGLFVFCFFGEVLRNAASKVQLRKCGA